MADNGTTRSRKRLEVAAKHQRALDLRIQGKTLKTIKEELGFATESCVCNAIKRLLAKREQASADEMRKLANERLDLLMEPWMQAAKNLDQDRAAEIVLKIQSQITTLNGLAAPTKVSLGSDPDHPLQLRIILERGAEILANVPEMRSALPIEKASEPLQHTDEVQDASDG